MTKPEMLSRHLDFVVPSSLVIRHSFHRLILQIPEC